MKHWKAVDWLDGYLGVLEVSDCGKVRRKSYKYTTTGRWEKPFQASKPDKVLSQYTAKGDYPEIAVQVNRRRKKFRVHHLVARAFCPGYSPGLCVNHINGKKNDNRAANLEWVTLARNTQHQWEIGLIDHRGDNHPQRKLNSGKVRIIRRLLAIGANSCELATGHHGFYIGSAVLDGLFHQAILESVRFDFVDHVQLCTDASITCGINGRSVIA